MYDLKYDKNYGAMAVMVMVKKSASKENCAKSHNLEGTLLKDWVLTIIVTIALP